LNPRATLRSIGPAVLIAALAFTFTVDWRVQGRTRERLEGRRAQLAALVDARQRRAGDLEARLDELRQEFSRAAARSNAPALQSLRTQVDRLAGLAGARAIRGAGVIVRMSDATDTNDELNEGDARIQDVDIQAVVNQLWLAGAEAIAVNGQRLVTTSAIRNAGGAVLVNYRVLTSPYRVAAVGDARRISERLHRSEIAQRFRAWREIYGLGFKIETSADVRLPAFSGSVRFRYARAIDPTDKEDR